MTHDIRAVANYLLDQADLRGILISNMALNKILYFSQGWYLSTQKKPLFLQEFEAWKNGPVSPVIYQQFKEWGAGAIKSRAKSIDLAAGGMRTAKYSLSEAEREHLDKMLEFYGHKSAALLSHMSHEEGAPWDMVRKSDAHLGMKIPNSAIQEFFDSKLNKKYGGDA